jgi:hypothetical protein
VNLRGEVAVHEVRHEVEVDDLPHNDVADGSDERDQDAAGEGAAEGDLARERVVAVAADAEVDEQERRHHRGIAEYQAVAGADLVGDQKRAAHKHAEDDAGDETEDEDVALHDGAVKKYIFAPDSANPSRLYNNAPGKVPAQMQTAFQR